MVKGIMFGSLMSKEGDGENSERLATLQKIKEVPVRGEKRRDCSRLFFMLGE